MLVKGRIDNLNFLIRKKVTIPIQFVFKKSLQQQKFWLIVNSRPVISWNVYICRYSPDKETFACLWHDRCSDDGWSPWPPSLEQGSNPGRRVNGVKLSPLSPRPPLRARFVRHPIAQYRALPTYTHNLYPIFCYQLVLNIPSPLTVDDRWKNTINCDPPSRIKASRRKQIRRVSLKNNHSKVFEENIFNKSPPISAWFLAAASKIVFPLNINELRIHKTSELGSVMEIWDENCSSFASLCEVYESYSLVSISHDFVFIFLCFYFIHKQLVTQKVGMECV